MTFKTKFSIGDKVFRLSKYSDHKHVECSVCRDSRQVEIQGTKYVCPACAGGSHAYFDRWYVHQDETTVGEVRVQVKLAAFHNCNYFDESEIEGDGGIVKEQYMLAATGIGSGTLWDAHDLFSTLAEAQTEKDSRNRALIAQEEALPK